MKPQEKQALHGNDPLGAPPSESTCLALLQALVLNASTEKHPLLSFLHAFVSAAFTQGQAIEVVL